MTFLRGTALAEWLFKVVFLYMRQGLTPIRVTSYKGGTHTPGSQHPLGTAVDIGIRTPAERAAALELMRRWRALGLYGQLESDHVHLQLFNAGQDEIVVGD